MKVRTLLIVGAVMAVLVGMTTANSNQGPQNRNGGSQSRLAGLELTELEVSNILLMREEEKLARDVYLILYDLWGADIFSNIAESEQQHMDAIENLISRYGLTDPVVDDRLGAFSNPELTELYDGFVEAGKVSLEEALKVGVMIEELDIADLEQAMSETDRPNILRVFGNLLDGSENHLDAFNACLAGDCVSLPDAS
jgi:hypothetical protein